jgi:arylsulfatase
MEREHPNLLFLYTDEQTWRTLAAYGNHDIAMPNLDRLAATSTVFEQAYCTQPICTPSRASLLTGLYPHTTGCTANNIPLSPDTRCLPELLSHGDYVTGHFGKWHLGNEVFAQHGFQAWVSVEDGYAKWFSGDRDPNARSTYHAWLVNRGCTPRDGDAFSRTESARLPEALGKPAFLAGEAARFIRRHRNDRFILYVNFLEPHMPFFGPRDGQYDPATVPLPAAFDWPVANHPLKARVFARAYYERGMNDLPLRTEDEWRRLIANYWGLCSLVDTHVGAILDTLEETGLADNTLVVFTSDHGDMMGAHRLLGKAVMFEEAIRVPLLVRAPGQRRGNRVSGPVSQVDLVPSLLDLLGQPLPDGLQGRSRRTEIEGRGAPGKPLADPVFVEWNGTNTGIVGEAATHHVPEALADAIDPKTLTRHIADPVRTIIMPDGWKLNLSTLGEHELYNLQADPHERRNLATEGGARGRLASLQARIREWQQATGDTAGI